MCGPAVVPWVIGAIGIGVVKHQYDQAQKGMQNAVNEANARVTAPAPTPAPAALMTTEPMKEVDAQAQAARQQAKKKAAALAGMGGTLKTGGLGIPGPAATTGKTLLGQ